MGDEGRFAPCSEFAARRRAARESDKATTASVEGADESQRSAGKLPGKGAKERIDRNRANATEEEHQVALCRDGQGEEGDQYVQERAKQRRMIKCHCHL